MVNQFAVNNKVVALDPFQLKEHRTMSSYARSSNIYEASDNLTLPSPPRIAVVLTVPVGFVAEQPLAVKCIIGVT
jgi:hypothetical protein